MCLCGAFNDHQKGLVFCETVTESFGKPEIAELSDVEEFPWMGNFVPC